jgi:hypothetical protein
MAVSVLHWPATHTPPAGQALPQLPQLAASLCRSTHWVPHIVAPAEHHPTHWPLEHPVPPGYTKSPQVVPPGIVRGQNPVAYESGPHEGHRHSGGPGFRGGLRLQFSVPALQVTAHDPLLHVVVPNPGLHAPLQLPQATGSDVRSWQAPEQFVFPNGHTATQFCPSQSCPGLHA